MEFYHVIIHSIRTWANLIRAVLMGPTAFKKTSKLKVKTKTILVGSMLGTISLGCSLPGEINFQKRSKVAISIWKSTQRYGSFDSFRICLVSISITFIHWRYTDSSGHFRSYYIKALEKLIESFYEKDEYIHPDYLVSFPGFLKMITSTYSNAEQQKLVNTHWKTYFYSKWVTNLA